MKHIKYNAKDKLDGIFNYFNRINKPYLFDAKGTILPDNANAQEPLFVTKRDQPAQYFWASDQSSPFILFSFSYSVRVTGYTLTSAGSSSLQHSYPEEFVVEASNNLANWKQLDYQTNQKFCEQEQCYSSNTTHYEINNRYFGHYIRITNIKNSAYDDAYLILRSVEFFGFLNPYGAFTNQQYPHIYQYIFIFPFPILE